ncbi:WD40 repeat domain-containing protein [Bacillus sp. 31A1R]|uniref:WD40 repeat domain-containing protein n=1 Tax=Robertmurraya mangrovi TaxID=3098077 RepID=A0ABU5J5K7_9BACI|nr:WD40 repeat domain-containing protein [Bacillus sp. 31A1R]MDZ5474637.1 WD40 repeat domain-containing protein [Bacillus sp. 31A1R]
MVKRYFLIPCCFLIMLVLTSCENKDFPRIKEIESMAITVNIKDMTLSFIDLHTEMNVNTWKLKNPYSGGILFPDGDSLLLYGKQVETVDLYSLKEGKAIASWETGKGIVNAKYLKKNNEIVFADQHQHAIRFFTLEGKETGKVKTAQNPLTLIEKKDSNELYVISFNDEKTTIIDVEKKEKLKEFNIHSSAAGALLRKGMNEMWVGGHGVGEETETQIHVYDSLNGKLLRTISAPMMPINFTQMHDYIFVLSHGSSTLYQLDKDGIEQNSIKVGANPFELKATNEQLLVAGYDSNDIHIVDSYTLEIKTAISVGKGPFQIILREGQ